MLKFARLYGFDHVRTAEQTDKTWGELQTALSGESEGDILIAGSGNQLLLNGAPLGKDGADRAQALEELFSRKPGETQVRLRLESPRDFTVLLDVASKVRPDREFRAQVERICGEATTHHGETHGGR